MELCGVGCVREKGATGRGGGCEQVEGASWWRNGGGVRNER